MNLSEYSTGIDVFGYFKKQVSKRKGSLLFYWLVQHFRCMKYYVFTVSVSYSTLVLYILSLCSNAGLFPVVKSAAGFAPQWDSVGKSGRLPIWSEMSWHNS